MNTPLSSGFYIPEYIFYIVYGVGALLTVLTLWLVLYTLRGIYRWFIKKP